MAQKTFKSFTPLVDGKSPDIVVGKSQEITFPLWSDSPLDTDTTGQSILETFYTSSTETSNWEGNYYYHVYAEDTDSNANAPEQFSIAYATSGSFTLDYDSDSTLVYTYPSFAIYRQFANVLLDGKSETDFSISGSTNSEFYIISIDRDRIKDNIQPATWQLNLKHNTMLNLIAQSGSTGQTEFDVVSGYLDDYTGEQMSGGGLGIVYGKFYSDKGIIILDALKVYENVTETAAGTTLSGNAYNPRTILDGFYNFISTGSYFRARTTEKIRSLYYFARANHDEFNYSNNPSFVTGSTNEIKNEFYEDPKVWITSVGLYDGTVNNDDGRAVAVAKLSRPILKTPESEVVIRIKLDF